MHKFSADVVLRWRDDSQWLLLFSFTLHGYTVKEVFCILKKPSILLKQCITFSFNVVPQLIPHFIKYISK